MPTRSIFRLEVVVAVGAAIIVYGLSQVSVLATCFLMAVFTALLSLFYYHHDSVTGETGPSHVPTSASNHLQMPFSENRLSDGQQPQNVSNNSNCVKSYSRAFGTELAPSRNSPRARTNFAVNPGLRTSDVSRPNRVHFGVPSATELQRPSANDSYRVAVSDRDVEPTRMPTRLTRADTRTLRDGSRHHTLPQFQRLNFGLAIVCEVTGHFSDKPTCGQSSHGLVNSWTSQLTEMFYL